MPSLCLGMKFSVPFLSLAAGVEKDEGTFARRREDLDLAILVNVLREDLSADAGVVVNQFRNPLNGPSVLANEFEAVENGRVVHLVFIVDVSVRPPAFAGDDAGQAVAIKIRKLERVQFSERDGFVGLFPLLAVCQWFGGIAHNQVTFPRAVSLSIACLLEPSKTRTVRVETCDHVRNAVAVHVVNENVAAAAQKPLTLGSAKWS